MKNDTPTPRSDEAVQFGYRFTRGDKSTDYVPADFARELERELAEATSEVARLKRNIGCARNQGTTQFCAEAVALQAELAASVQARRELVQALETAIRDCDSYGWEISEDTYDAMRQTLAKHAQNGGDK